MKQLKPLNMFVPESDYADRIVGNTYGLKVNTNKVITRQEIYDLVKARAEKWGYDKVPCCTENGWQYIVFESDGLWGCFVESINKNPEISWQDFLKLAPGDVITEPMQIFNQANFGKKTTTDREIFEKETGNNAPVLGSFNENNREDVIKKYDNELIVYLQAYVIWLEKRNEWVSVDERLPEVPCIAEWSDGQYTLIVEDSQDYIKTLVNVGIYSEENQEPVKIIKWTHAPPDEAKRNKS